MDSTPRDRAIARRTFLGAAAVFTAAGIVGSIRTDDEKARSAFVAAAAEWEAAVASADAAALAWEDSRTRAETDAGLASGLLSVVDTSMLDDVATADTAQAALDNVVSLGELTVVAAGDITHTAIVTPARATPEVPEGRAEQYSAASELATATTQLVADTEGIVANTDALDVAVATMNDTVLAVMTSAHTKGTAAEVPSMASQETKDAYSAAVDALEDHLAGTPAERVHAYQEAWAAVLSSHEEAESAAANASSSAGESTNGVAEPTYVSGILIANKTYALPSWYGNGLTGATASSFESMRAEAAALGLSLWIASGFRSYATQVAVYNRWVSQEGVAAADRHSARPGHSEHQSGLAFDLNTISEAFGYTPEGQWVAANAHRFGFIVRYPQGKEGSTGYIWEPWHLRYLGVDVATAVYDSGLSLEEYLGITSVYQ
ncbi:hypothetical protein GCM10009808_06990 [Microbacterium sediminicola]|uniref:Plant heme peroxidase family profile domain-containing protein n=1 Tax=Microbacterium sediminicola TaxID=415210 RepID=A0ABN2HRY5_9MICO